MFFIVFSNTTNTTLVPQGGSQKEPVPWAAMPTCSLLASPTGRATGVQKSKVKNIME
ncbi:hypothetical protein [Nostoc commune]|uniref:hypothetical protein n=1 Tax=Nostoc commune TaxID=1178 RepID=UPI0020733198|nr:hypothetical protein [Nostoc commune]